MPLIPTALAQGLEKVLSGPPASHREAAQGIVGAYTDYAKHAQSVTMGNPIAFPGQEAATELLANAFDANAKPGVLGLTAAQLTATCLAQGLLSLWTGVTFDGKVPVPPAVAVVSEIVTVPGLGPASPMFAALVQLFGEPPTSALTVAGQAHRLAMALHLYASGIVVTTVQMVPTPAGPPAPVPSPSPIL